MIKYLLPAGTPIERRKRGPFEDPNSHVQWEHYITTRDALIHGMDILKFPPPFKNSAFIVVNLPLSALPYDRYNVRTEYLREVALPE